MKSISPLTPLFVPSFSSKGNLLIQTKDGKYVSDNYDLFQVLDVRIANSYLVSAYDIFYGYMPKDPNEWPDTDYLFIDSGGYEINDSYDLSERNKFNYNVFPWDIKKMKEVYHFITSCPKFSNSAIILSSYDIEDTFEIQLDSALRIADEFPEAFTNFIIKPRFPFEQLLRHISENIAALSEHFKIIGLTEKELGSTIRDRLLNLITLKELLNSLSWNGYIHIFGGLEPALSRLYYIAGADIFDGLSWQRMRYCAGTTVFDPDYYNISMDEFQNKYRMMIDNLAVMHEMSNNLSSNSDNRSDKMKKLKELLQHEPLLIKGIMDNLEV